MSKNIQFDSLYKFIVSIGLVLFAIPFTFWTIIYKDNTLLLIKEEDISKITDTAKQTIYMKQDFVSNLLEFKYTFINIISFVLFGLGLALIIYGLLKWNKIQKQSDRKGELENEKLLLEMTSITEQEQNKEKKAKEDEEIIILDSGEFGDYQLNHSSSKTEKDLEEILNRTANINIQKIRSSFYNEIETKIAQKIAQDCKNNNIYQNVKIGEKYFDIVAVEKLNPSKIHIIYEIRYITGKISITWLNNCLKQFLFRLKNSGYALNTQSVIVLVTDDDNYENVKEVAENTKLDHLFKVQVVRVNDISKTKFKI